MSKKILIIDDEPGHREMLKTNLEILYHYEVFLSENGQKGLESVVLNKPDLVLLDIIMPGMDGLETLKRIKAVAPELPVAMVTGTWKKGEEERCRQAGAYDYISKPINSEKLKSALLSKLFG